MLAIVGPIREDWISGLAFLRHRLGEGSHGSRWYDDRRLLKLLDHCLALMHLSVAEGVFFAECNAELDEPGVVTCAGGCPDRTRMLCVSRTIRPATYRAEHLRRLQRHLYNVLVKMEAGCLRDIAAKYKDIHFRTAKEWNTIRKIAAAKTHADSSSVMLTSSCDRRCCEMDLAAAASATRWGAAYAPPKLA